MTRGGIYSESIKGKLLFCLLACLHSIKCLPQVVSRRDWFNDQHQQVTKMQEDIHHQEGQVDEEGGLKCAKKPMELWLRFEINAFEYSGSQGDWQQGCR